MNMNLPQKCNKGIFAKIKSFFSRLFTNKSKKQTIQNSQNAPKTNNEENSAEMLKTDLQVMRDKTIKELEKEELIKQIEDNPDLINSWPIEKLKILAGILKNRIEQTKEKIDKYEKEINIIRKNNTVQ